MSPLAPVPLARAQQRLLFAGLGLAAGLALLQQLLFPLRPPLPRPPSGLPAAGGWHWTAAAAGSLAGKVDSGLASGAPGPLWQRQTQVGPSRRFTTPAGTWLMITPLASWSLKELAPFALSRELSGVHLANPSLLTVIANQRQLASGRLHGRIAYQSCLTARGTMAPAPPLLVHLSRHPSATARAKVAESLWPASSRGYFCLLLTTNSPALLAGSTPALQFSQALAQATAWPR